MAIQITNLGIIKGGACEKRFRQRSGRERGVRMALDHFLGRGYIVFVNGWGSVIRLPNYVHSNKWIIPNICRVWGGDTEIGWRRFVHEIAEPYYESKRH
jgi:hypothetical protein